MEKSKLMNEPTKFSDADLTLWLESLDDWFDSKQVCKLLGISKRTLANYRQKGLLPFSRFFRRTYYKRSDINNFLKDTTSKQINRKEVCYEIF